MGLNKQEIGQRLKIFANSYGGVSKLARALEISVQNFSGSYISGKSIPGGEIIAKLMELGCDINWLLTGSTQSVNVHTKDIKKSVQNIGSGNQITNLASGSPQSADDYAKLLQRYNYLWDELIELKSELAKCKEQLHGSGPQINTSEGKQ